MRILRVLLSLLEMAERLPPSSSSPSSSSLKKADQRQEHFFLSPKRYEVMKLVNNFVEMLSLQQIFFPQPRSSSCWMCPTGEDLQAWLYS